MSNNDSSDKESTDCGCPVDTCGYTGRTVRGMKIHLAKSHDDKTKRAVYIRDLRRVASVVGGSPTAEDYREHGEYSLPTYKNHFGSWNGAVESAGLVPVRERNIPTDVLLAHLHEVAQNNASPPRMEDMASSGSYAATTYIHRFGSWNAALKAAGLSVNKPHAIPRDELLDELQHLAAVLERTPTMNDMAWAGKYHSEPYMNTFGSWSDALQAAELPVQWRFNIPDSDLVEEIQRLADDLGRAPHVSDMTVEGKYNWKAYRRAFGSWNAAIGAAGFDTFEPLMGEDHPRYTPFGNTLYVTLRKFYGTEPWRTIRRRILKRYGGECQFEGCDSTAVDVHHIEPIMSAGTNDDDLLMPLCTVHHRRVEVYTTNNLTDMTIRRLVGEFHEKENSTAPT